MARGVTAHWASRPISVTAATPHGVCRWSDGRSIRGNLLGPSCGTFARRCEQCMRPKSNSLPQSLLPPRKLRHCGLSWRVSRGTAARRHQIDHGGLRSDLPAQSGVEGHVAHVKSPSGLASSRASLPILASQIRTDSRHTSLPAIPAIAARRSRSFGLVARSPSGGPPAPTSARRIEQRVRIRASALYTVLGGRSNSSALSAPLFSPDIGVRSILDPCSQLVEAAHQSHCRLPVRPFGVRPRPTVAAAFFVKVAAAGGCFAAQLEHFVKRDSASPADEVAIRIKFAPFSHKTRLVSCITSSASTRLGTRL